MAAIVGIAMSAGGGSGGSDDGGSTPPKPDDGGNTSPDQTLVTTAYPNGLSVTMVPGATTASLTLIGETMQAMKQANGTWLVTDSTCADAGSGNGRDHRLQHC